MTTNGGVQARVDRIDFDHEDDSWHLSFSAGGGGLVGEVELAEIVAVGELANKPPGSARASEALLTAKRRLQRRFLSLANGISGKIGHNLQDEWFIGDQQEGIRADSIERADDDTVVATFHVIAGASETTVKVAVNSSVPKNIPEVLSGAWQNLGRCLTQMSSQFGDEYLRI